MAYWFKWWNDKTFMKIFGIAISAVAIAALSAVLLEWGWVISIAAAVLGGYFMKKILFRRLDEIANNKNTHQNEPTS